MKIIVGLGNPGRDYDRTRHNIGFMVIDSIVGELAGVSRRNRFKADLVEGAIGQTKVVLAKPQMYMNLSGIPVRELVNWYKADLADLLIIYDDMDLPLGQLRMRGDGSAGGHNGMKSIISELGTAEFPRLRIGIGRGGGSSVAHVLSRFTPEESVAINDAVSASKTAVERWLNTDLLTAMNETNRPAVSAPASESV